ncbi:hypothetical protein GGH12_001449 [Coemansia sp. RSA 1822]|nr:hypothetical protein LPJ76_001600 [Coemansia sp. RSA 638]KAJ2123078.1 hypothetical protein IW147_002898 [Coemansia sp. RSA 720]KAJ2544399.1 hypothetical protein GGF49_001260 [Coemansia sp. RSA 1853]KAJ2565416.1 hypothetical protein GGH12_001449 [Coemansia sp. RSA 1822]
MRHLVRRAFSTSTSVTKARGWRTYVDRFRDRPASHITAFAVLHEITAIAPLAAVYYALSYYQPPLIFPARILEEGNRYINKLRTYVGLKQLDADSPVLVHLATSYAIIKALAPVRIAASLALTPWTAKWCIVPVAKTIETLSKAVRSKFKP